MYSYLYMNIYIYTERTILNRCILCMETLHRLPSCTCCLDLGQKERLLSKWDHGGLRACYISGIETTGTVSRFTRIAGPTTATWTSLCGVELEVWL